MIKFAKEEWLSSHIHFQRWVLPFIYGLVINLIQWAVDKGKVWICINCTHGGYCPDTAPEGSINTYIPSLLEDNADECPPIFNKSTLNNFLR